MEGLQLWSALSKAYLGSKLQEEFDNLKTLGIKYLSIHDDDQKKYFVKDLDWMDAINICSTTCAGISDAMIINALQATNFPFVISLDTDVVYAVLSDTSLT